MAQRDDNHLIRSYVYNFSLKSAVFYNTRINISAFIYFTSIRESRFSTHIQKSMPEICHNFYSSGAGFTMMPRDAAEKKARCRLRIIDDIANWRECREMPGFKTKRAISQYAAGWIRKIQFRLHWKIMMIQYMLEESPLSTYREAAFSIQALQKQYARDES